MMEFLKRYSGYQFFEMLAVLAVTGFQVHLIKKMFTTDSIVWFTHICVDSHLSYNKVINNQSCSF